MSLILVDFYKKEEGVHNNPVFNDVFNTHCDGGVEGLLPKKFFEVFIDWDNDLSQWVEVLVYTPAQTKVALKVINNCNDTFSYLAISYEDFRIKQLCCRNEAFLVTEDGQNILTEDDQPILV